MSFVMGKSKSKKGALVSEEFTLFNQLKFSGIYPTYHSLELRIINIKQVILS